MRLLVGIINDMMERTAKSPKHTLVVHSLTGKGRVGVVCSCYLLLTGFYGSVFKLHTERERRELVNATIRDFWNARGGGAQSGTVHLLLYEGGEPPWSRA